MYAAGDRSLSDSAHRRGEIYDRLARDYDRAMRPLERLLLARLRQEALKELPAGGRLLEVGAGTGANFPLYPEGASVAACEPSREMIEIARKNPKRTSRVSLVRCRAERLPFKDDSFDAALATLVFCSVERPAQGFAELARVVRPGGRIVLLEHVRPEGLLGRVFDALNRLTVALFEDHFNRRTADEARSAGLRIERVERRALGIVQLIVCRAE